MRRLALVAVIGTVVISAAAFRTTPMLDNGLARTPPMGWNSWNKFGCNVSDKLIREVADAISANGMRDAGYQYVTIDDCWQVARTSQGVIVADSVRFPQGIKALADYVHGKGLKIGIYSSPGPRTCQQRFAGSWQHDNFTEAVENFTMVGKPRNDLFVNYIAAVERGECRAPRLVSAYHAHKYCRNVDLFGQTEAAQQDAPTEGGRNRKGHPPDVVVAAALAYHGALQLRNPLALAGSVAQPQSGQRPSGTEVATSVADQIADVLGRRQ